MAKVRKSTAPVSLSKALKLATKRLGITDPDYAEKRLGESLKTAELGRGWFLQVVDPPDARFDDLWCDPNYTIDWERSQASTWILIKASGGDTGFERATAYGISIAPAIIAALMPVTAKPKPPVRISKYRRRLERAARRIIGRDGRPDNLQGEGGLLEKVTLEIGEENMPTAESWTVEILKPIHDEGRSG
jgi:hypothetical protein